MISRIRCSVGAVIAIAFFYSTLALGWGEAGHDIVTRVAVRLLKEKKDAALQTVPFAQREHMLAHLANTPDIVWRDQSQPANDRAQNSPTHYLNIESVVKDPSTRCLADFPLTYSDANAKAGSSPWRAQQFYFELISALKKTKNSATNPKESAAYNDHINAALTNAGLLSHFIGDMAQPLHATSDFDGWGKAQGGLHAYFESDVVDELGLELPHLVFQSAKAHAPAAALSKLRNQHPRFEKSSAALFYVFALGCDSYAHVAPLLALDHSHSLIKASVQERGMNLKPATRKSAAAVAAAYQDFIIARMAVGADVLAELWWQAWLQSGKPDLSRYQSYYYPWKLPFLAPDYLK